MTRGLLLFALLFCAFAGAGCVTFKEEEFAAIRARQVSPAVYRKLKERQPVTPPEIVELWQKRVPPVLIERQLDKVGVDYAMRQSDVDLLQGAGVGAGVIEALRAASERFVTRYAPPEYFEAHNLHSGDYLVTPPARSTGSLLYGPNILQR